MPDKKTIPILDSGDAASWLANSRRPFHDKMYAFYSSEFEGIVLDPLYMSVPVDDHLTHRGDGVFETLKCTNRRIYCFREHLDRLFSSADKICLTPAWDKNEIGRIICATIQAADKNDCLVRVILSRGPGSMGINPYDSHKPNLYILVHHAQPPFMTSRPEGARVITSGIPVKAGVFATIKSCNYLPNAMLKKQAADSGADFAAGFDENGFLSEGATENFGILTPDHVLTVPNPDRILSGTTMNRVLDLAGAGVKDGWLSAVRKDNISSSDLLAASEVYIFGTTTDVTAVVEIDGKPIGSGKPGNVYNKLSRLLLAEQNSDNPHTFNAFA